LATLFGVKAFDLVQKGEFGKMVILKGTSLDSISLSEVAKTCKKIDSLSFEIQAAKAIGISFGD
jgi:hypothetical protein